MSRQNYYARRRKRQRRKTEAGLVLELVRRERQIQPRLGGRKLHYMLREEMDQAGVRMGRDRFFEVLREGGLLVEPRRAEWPCTTNARHNLPLFRNLIEDLEVSHSNEVWVGDVTYLRTEEGFQYLALLTDKKSRKVVGYHCGDTLEAIGCIRALEMALEDLPEGARTIVHSDRGSQYCSHEYVERVEGRGLVISMTERNHCAENALAERMNGILKSEYGLGLEFRTKEQAREAVVEAVWLYNHRRPHTCLGYQVPADVHSLAA